MSTATAFRTARIRARIPTKGSYFTRGTTKDRYARYTEEGPAYVDNMQRLLRKFETAKSAAARSPRSRRPPRPTKAGVIWFGSTGCGHGRIAGRARAAGRPSRPHAAAWIPFHDSVAEFIAEHEHVFVVEQNRDAQLKMLLVNECGVDPSKLISVLNYDGTPITERFITREIGRRRVCSTLRRCRQKDARVRNQKTGGKCRLN